MEVISNNKNMRYIKNFDEIWKVDKMSYKALEKYLFLLVNKYNIQLEGLKDNMQ